MDDKTKALIQLLGRAGWRRDATRIISPRETISLDCANPWSGSIEKFQDRLKARIKLIRDNEPAVGSKVSWNNTLMDTLSLITCLETVFGTGGVADD